MQPTGGQTNYRVSGSNVLAIQNSGFLDDANNCAAKVILTILIKARHLSGLPANERTTVRGAGLGKAFDDIGKNVRIEFAGADVIQKEKRFGPEHGDVINTMVHQILADGVMAVHREGDLQFGADAIDT